MPPRDLEVALRQLLEECLGLEDALAMEGSGWDGDLDELRSFRVARA